MNNIIAGSVCPSLAQLQETVNTSITEDTKATDLLTYFKDPALVDKYSTDNIHSFIKNPTLSFPKALEAELEKLDYNYGMGFLEPIHHIWISSGKTLFLWNYNNTEDAIFRYNHETELIENVDIVKTLTEYDLVVSTKRHLYLHPIQLSNNEKGKLSLAPAKMIKSDGVVMSNFHSTNTRRIFMQGDDGHIYELDLKDNGQNLIVCHTHTPLMRYLGYFFKSVPESPAKSLVVDDHNKLLYFLSIDSTIHTVNIQTNWQVMSRYTATGTTLASIHHIPSTESKEYNLLAITNKGDRLYFHCKNTDIELKHMRPAPPILPGSLLFNRFTEETCDLSLYRDGIFATTLSKSERKYLVLAAGGVIRDTTNPYKSVYVEDVYYEPIHQKIWSITETSTSISFIKHHCLKETLEFPDSPARRISTLSESGITHYTKQRPIDYLNHVLVKEEVYGVEAFVKRYGPVEACALGFLLGCSSKHSPQNAQFLVNAEDRDDGFLLHFARIVPDIWDVDILKSESLHDQFKEVQGRLRTLLRLVYSAKIEIKKEPTDLLRRAIEGISLVCFAHDQDWHRIKESLGSNIEGRKFSDFVSTEKGALLAKEVVLTLINTTTLSNASNHYNFIGEYLENECSIFLGEYNVTYYKGIECLQVAIQTSTNTAAVELSLNHFRNIVEFMDLDTLQPICDEYAKLHNHLAAVTLAHAKHQTDASSDPKIYDLIFTTLQDALDNNQNHVINRSLQLSTEVDFHYKIYDWLKENNHSNLLVSLTTPLLYKYIKTQLPAKESLLYLKLYHHHRNELNSAIECLFDLAKLETDMPLQERVDYLQRACDYLPTDQVTNEQMKTMRYTLKESQIQLDLYITLTKESGAAAAKNLATRLLLAQTLYQEFAYTHKLYEQGLQLIKLMDIYEFEFGQTAWCSIIDQYGDDKDALKSKIFHLAQKLYPCIAGFPVYYIYKALQRKLRDDQDFATQILIEAGVPEEVLEDATKR